MNAGGSTEILLSKIEGGVGGGVYPWGEWMGVGWEEEGGCT